MKAALIHVIGDIIQSLGVVIASVIIYFKPNWSFIDPICTFIFSVIVMFTTVSITKQCISVLMEAAPEKFQNSKISRAIKKKVIKFVVILFILKKEIIIYNLP